jgi:hypothetical protein
MARTRPCCSRFYVDGLEVGVCGIGESSRPQRAGLDRRGIVVLVVSGVKRVRVV